MRRRTGRRISRCSCRAPGSARYALGQAGGDDLHRLGVVAVGDQADFLDPTVPGRKEGGMPAVQRVLAQGFSALLSGRLQPIERGFGACVALSGLERRSAQAAVRQKLGPS